MRNEHEEKNNFRTISVFSHCPHGVRVAGELGHGHLGHFQSMTQYTQRRASTRTASDIKLGRILIRKVQNLQKKSINQSINQSTGSKSSSNSQSIDVIKVLLQPQFFSDSEGAYIPKSYLGVHNGRQALQFIH